MEHVELFGGDTGKVDHASADEGSAIVDAYDYRSAITEIVDLDVGPEGKAAMGGGKDVGVHRLTAGCACTHLVPGGAAALCCRGRAGLKARRRRNGEKGESEE